MLRYITYYPEVCYPHPPDHVEPSAPSHLLFSSFRLIQVDPSPENGIWYCDFPIIGCVNEIGTQGRGDELTVPLLMGLLARNPANTILKNDRTRRMFYRRYPRPLTMQWF